MSDLVRVEIDTESELYPELVVMESPDRGRIDIPRELLAARRREPAAVSRLKRLQRYAQQFGVQVSRSDTRVRIAGRWWRLPGRYNVFIPGVMWIGPIRARDVPRRVHQVAAQNASSQTRRS